MNRSQACFAVAVTLVAVGASTPTRAYTGDDPVIVAGPSGIAACQYDDIRARIGPDNTVTYKIYGNCQGAAISGVLTFQAGEFYESFVISNREKIDTHGYCDSDPWATAINCHDQTLSAVGMNVEPNLQGRAPLSLLAYDSSRFFHAAFTSATRPNPPGMPVNFSATADFGQMTARWVAPDDSGDRPFLGFLVQVQPHGASGGAWTDFGRINWHTRPEYILPGKLPPLSSTVKAWDARVCAVTQLAQTCTPPLLPDSSVFHEVTEVKNDHSATAAAIIAAQPAPTVAFERVKTTGPMPPICDAAKSARARNSPAAPGLERQCAAQQGITPSAYTSATETTNDHSAQAALLQSNSPKALGRVTPTTVPGSTGIGTKSICEMAADARAAQRPTAAALQQRCDAENAAKAAAAPAPAGSGRYPPVLAPHDLIVGRISFSLDGQAVEQVTMGSQVAIACNYIVNTDSRAMSLVREWRGGVQAGGQVPQTMEFAGTTDPGSHEARVYWTPSVAGPTPISCVLNPGFENSEANGGNNRANVTVEVVSGDEPPPAPDDAPPAAEENAPAPPADNQ